MEEMGFNNMSPEEFSNCQEYMADYSLDLTYDIVTRKARLVDLIDTDKEVILSYDPFSIGEINQAELLNDLIDHYIETEEYEKCAELHALLLQVLNGKIDLSDRIYLTDKHFEVYDERLDNDVRYLIDTYFNNKFNQN